MYHCLRHRRWLNHYRHCRYRSLSYHCPLMCYCSHQNQSVMKNRYHHRLHLNRSSGTTLSMVPCHRMYRCYQKVHNLR
jgi:hypothetical protein